jgi:pantoate--beta-alanine ligase
VIAGPTLREEDGLAMSSRNQYLTDDERNIAPALHRVLRRTAAAVQSGNRDFAALEAQGLKEMAEAGFLPDYLAIRRAENLAVPDRDDDHLVVLAAAHLGAARLIDNVLVEI